METVDTDVLVVGAGPTGLTAASILARAGVRALTISQYAGTAHNPRAHITNARTMEVFRDLGIEERIQEVGYRLQDLSYNLLTTSWAGLEIARYKSYGTPLDRLSDYAAASPCTGYNVQQIVMEPVLAEAAREQGADIRFNHQLMTISQEQDHVSARVLRRDTNEEYEVRARYVIGADGGNSTVASQLGFSFIGEAGLRGMANCWLEVDLEKYAAHRPAVLNWVAQPGHEQWFGTASWAMVNPWHDWVMVFPWNQSEAPSEEAVLERARLTIGDDEAEIRVKGISTWQVNNVVATEYRKGNVFLAGDAAHRHPPAGGLGTNTSVQDAFNLCWKLVAVLNGTAGDALLDTYEAERQPVGAHVVERAITNLNNMATLVDALGFEKDQSLEDGWAALHELYEDSPRAGDRRRALWQQIGLQHYRSNALGVELGQRYESTAVVDDGTPFPVQERDPDLHYQPTTHPGAHLPHAWIEHERQQLSTLDLVGQGAFTLLVGIGCAPWLAAAEGLAEELGIALNIRRVGLRCEYDDVVGEWDAVREVDDRGAILVRPDRHVAWRSMSMASDPRGALESAVSQVLGHSSSADAKNPPPRAVAGAAR